MKFFTFRWASFSNLRHTLTEISNILKGPLEDTGLPLENMAVYVTDNAFNAQKLAKNSDMNKERCVARSPNLIVQKCIIFKGEDSTQTTIGGLSDRLKNISDAIEIIRKYSNYFGNSTIGS